MFISVIILGVCIACQVNTGLAAPSTSYANLTTERNSQSSQIQIEQNWGFTYEDDNQTHGIVHGQQGTSNESNIPSDNSTSNSIPTEIIYVRPSDVILPLIGGKPLEQIEVVTFELIEKPQALTAKQMVYHVGIYSRLYTPYMQICGGTLVTTKAVISAAHCFWDENEAASPALFAVGAGKRYRPWNDPKDTYNQKSDVAEIHIPVRYRGSATSYQEDIAVVLLVEEFEVNFAVRPACISFDEDFDSEQLKKGSMGTILGWGLTQEDGDPSQVLNYLELPAVSIEECINSADGSFLRYITSDKICAGVTTGKAVCRGDSGGGLVFAEGPGAVRVPYLRGVASTAPRSEREHKCNAYALAALTHVRAHRDFLRRHIPGVEDECKKHYPGAPLRYEEEKKPENIKTTQPVQFVCNCYCNNTKPMSETIRMYD